MAIALFVCHAATLDAAEFDFPAPQPLAAGGFMVSDAGVQATAVEQTAGIAPLPVTPVSMTTMQQQSRTSQMAGRAMYERKCTGCHVLYKPTAFPARQWPIIVRSMKSEAALQEKEIQAITQYLVNASQGASSTTAAIDQQLFGQADTYTLSSAPRLGGYLYTEYFSTPSRSKNFDIHYLALTIDGWMNEKIQYWAEFELEHGGRDDHTFVEEAWLDYWFLPNVGVKIGCMLTPFNRFDEFHDPLANYCITRPQVSREIGVSAWKDVGVDLHGYFSLTDCASIVFDTYMINGLGAGSNLRGSRQYRDNNENLGFGGRTRLLLHDKYELGFSGYQGAWDDAGELDVRMLGCHFLAQTPIADLYGEWSWATSENPAPTDEGRMTGFFVQASRLVCEKYRPTIRVGSLDYHDTGSLLGRDPSKGDKDLGEVVFCLGYYPTQAVVFKFEYILFLEGARAEPKDNDQFGFQAAVRF